MVRVRACWAWGPAAFAGTRRGAGAAVVARMVARRCVSRHGLSIRGKPREKRREKILHGPKAARAV